MSKKLELYKDYAKLRKSIGALQKSGKNPHFKNTFVELNTALQVINENLEKNNFITFIQLPFHKEGKNFLKTILVHKDGEKLECDLELMTTKQDPQMLGSSLTYARRYSLITMLGLQCVDDDGNNGARRLPNRQKANTTVRGEWNNEQKIQRTFIKLKDDLESCETLESLGLCFGNKKFQEDLKKLDIARKELIIGSKEAMKGKLK
jgi:hypothetical protein